MELGPLSAFLETDTDATCDRRLFLKRFGFGLAGLAGAGVVLGWMREASGLEVPFIPAEEGIILGKSESDLRAPLNSTFARSEYVSQPTLALAAEGTVWTAWGLESKGRNRLLLNSFDPASEKWGQAIPLTNEDSESQWLACYPRLCMTGGGTLLAVWIETKDRQWRMKARALDAATRQWGEPATLAQTREPGGAVWRPAVAGLGADRAMVVWEEKTAAGKPFVVRGMVINKQGAPEAEAFPIAEFPEGDCCRPSIAAHPKTESVAVVYDRYEGKGTTQVHLALLSAADGSRQHNMPITDHPATDLAPDATFSPDAKHLWIGWHSNRRGDDAWDIPRWYLIRALDTKDMRLYEPSSEPPQKDLDRRGTDQGFEFVRLACAAEGTLCVLGRPSHRFCLQFHRGRDWSPLYRFPTEGWGGRGQLAQGAFDPAGRLWVVRRDIGANVLERIEGIVGSSPVAPELRPVNVGSAARPLKNIEPHLEFPPVTIPPETRADATQAPKWNIYFGDIHQHTWTSDGMGDVDEIYRRARDMQGDDFCALTDHDNFVSRKILDAEYEEQKALADHFNEPGKFTTFFAQEWTTPRAGLAHGWGHKNLYAIRPDIPLFDHKDPRYQDTLPLFAALKDYEMIAIPHHIGWTGVDWENHDPMIQPLVEICSVHGAFEYMGNEPIPHRGGRPGHFLRDGLARGLRFGVCGGSDQHGLLWQHGVCWKRNVYRAGLTGVLAAECTREAIFEAMRKRRTFATTGVKLRPLLTIEDFSMGEEGEVSRPPRIQVNVLAAGEIKWISIIRNGEVITHYGGEGAHSRFTHTDDTLPENQTSYYYLRVVMEDGNMAWTSPIWITPRA